MTSSSNPLQPLSEHLYASLSMGPPPAAATADELSQRVQQAEWELRATAALLEILTEVEQCERLQEACLLLSHKLQALLSCQQVALGLSGRGRFDFATFCISGTVQPERRSEIARRFEAALAEAMLLEELTVCSATAEQPGLLAQQRLLECCGAGWLISGALLGRSGKAMGAWLFLGSRESEKAPQQPLINLLKASQPRVAASLDLHRRAERGPWLRSLAAVGQWLHGWKGRLATSLLGLLLVLMLIPTPYRIHTKCKVDPVVRRYVHAPFDGIVDKGLVEPGDLVTSQQPLARMDGREIRINISGLEAERNSEAVKLSGALARHEMGAAQMAELKIARIDLQLELLRARQAQLEIRSPLEGMILQGDLKRAEGMPVQMGQKLFEVAPLEHVLIQVAVPERDYPHAQAGQDVIVRLDALPGRSWRGKIRRIHAQCERWEHEHVFVAELFAVNPSQLLQPGMNGSATIVTHRHPWVWNIFHKTWEDLVAACGF